MQRTRFERNSLSGGDGEQGHYLDAVHLFHMGRAHQMRIRHRFELHLDSHLGIANNQFGLVVLGLDVQ